MNIEYTGLLEYDMPLFCYMTNCTKQNIIDLTICFLTNHNGIIISNRFPICGNVAELPCQVFIISLVRKTIGN